MEQASDAGKRRRVTPARLANYAYSIASRPFARISKVLSRKGLTGFLEQQLQSIPAGAKVLLVGSGGAIDQQVRAVAAQAGFDVVSTDIDPARGPDVVADLCSHDFGEGRFQAILVPEVLEHVLTPHLAVQNVHRSLAAGGKAVITAPFMFPIHDRPYDFYRYTRYGLAYLLRDFKTVEIRERNSWGEAIVVLWARFLIEKHWTARLFFPLGVLIALIQLPLLWLLGRMVRTDNMTTGYLVVATKGG